MAPYLSKKQWVLSHLIIVLILSLSLYQFITIHSHLPTITFLDVGQGDAILIKTPEYKNILIDAGPNGKVIEELGKKLGFFNQKIDLFILTHPDLDHYGGILDILQKYPINQVMLTGIASNSQLYLAFLNELKKQKIPIIYPNNDSDLQIGHNIYLDILYPFNGQSLIGQEAKNKNDTSISLIIRDATGTPLVLLTGDAEKRLERDLLLSGQSLKAPIFKLGHHGSKSSNTESFLSAIKPNTVIVSAGKDNKFGHPHKETIDRTINMNLRSTADEGAITFVLK